MVVTALITGGAAALKDVASDSVKSAYEALKSKLREKLKSVPGAEVAVEHAAAKPTVYRPLVEDALQQTHAADDPEVLRAAEMLAKLAEMSGTINAQVIDSRGVAVGHHSSVTYTEGASPTPPASH
jgi:hypothetical protein